MKRFIIFTPHYTDILVVELQTVVCMKTKMDVKDSVINNKCFQNGQGRQNNQKLSHSIMIFKLLISVCIDSVLW